ncbi:MAG TPA: DUF1801 domain-containing protein [Levilinea sp.]|nr:DUF1801 domain-containing protein [Levilinea sp.]
MRNKARATTVEAYLDELPAQRKEVVARVRQLILENLPEGYQESINWGMITYGIPLERYPNTYNQQPLSYIALAAQKNHYALYLMGCYTDSKQEAKLRAGYQKAGKKLDMGKSCLRFKKLDDLPFDVLAEVIASLTPDEFMRIYEQARARVKG